MPDPKTGALPLGYAPMRISETDRKQPNTYSKCFAILVPRNSRYGKLSPVDSLIKGFYVQLAVSLFCQIYAKTLAPLPLIAAFTAPRSSKVSFTRPISG